MFREIGCGSLTSRKRFGTALFAALVSILPVVSNPVAAEVLTPQQQLAFDIYKELVEINTVTATGDTASAAEAMAARLRAAGFTDAEVAEIVAHVALNVFTNFFNKVAGLAVDFPLVAARVARG